MVSIVLILKLRVLLPVLGKKCQRLLWAGVRFQRVSASNRENYLNILNKQGCRVLFSSDDSVTWKEFGLAKFQPYLFDLHLGKPDFILLHRPELNN